MLMAYAFTQSFVVANSRQFHIYRGERWEILIHVTATAVLSSLTRHHYRIRSEKYTGGCVGGEGRERGGGGLLKFLRLVYSEPGLSILKVH